MLRFCVGIAIWFLVIRFTQPKKFEIKGLIGILLFGMAVYGTGWLAVGLIEGIRGCS